MIEFILNNEYINTSLPGGSILLDYIRNEQGLTGTKTGCREGDCGACTVLIGSTDKNDEIRYKSVTSCLTPLESVHKKHVVTIEGLNLNKGLTPIQNIFIKNNATQCGFCTPGFIVSLTGFAINQNTTITGILDSISGNICRCTGYNSIKKASEQIAELLIRKNTSGSINKLIDADILPVYFREIVERLDNIKPYISGDNSGVLVGGGTDLYVSQISEVEDKPIRLTNSQVGNNIIINDKDCIINAGATASDIMHNKELQKLFPNLVEDFKLISSEQIRNMGTVGGNFVNASPIGDLAIFFLACNCALTIYDNKNSERNISLKNFFKGYKEIDLNKEELIKSLSFKIPDENTKFSFEKVSNRKHLDIASGNSAMMIKVENKVITDVHISVGGVSPIPLYLKNTSAFLKGKPLTTEMIKKAHCVLKEEISPISDVRGSNDYKQLLIRQLYYTHFIKLFPEIVKIGDLI